jgi:hypothetical protein
MPAVSRYILRHIDYKVQIFNSTKKAYKQWRKSGILHYVLIQNNYVLFTRRINGQIKEEVFTSLIELFQRINEERIEYTQNVFKFSELTMEKLRNKFTLNLCGDCFDGVFYGYYSDGTNYQCSHCGKHINRVILTMDPRKRFY